MAQNTAGLLPCNKGSAMLIFFLGVFLVACRSEWSILKPLKGGNAREFFFGRFSGRLPIGMVDFNP
jgi:hypothetical protein